MPSKYEPQKIERKWQRCWLDKKLYIAPDAVEGKKNYMLLTEFPYPSGNLHMGHWYAFALPDIRARYLRMNGYNVMYPIGFDAFGLPAENAAIRHDISPEKWTKQNIAFMTKQLESMGASFDWSRAVSTIDPDYYKWTQWMFLKMYEKGLAYRAKTLVNWCPNDKTVLANEQVVNGCCERCETPVVQKELTQWMLRITDYADRLIDDMKDLDWPETAKLAQKNWIGRSEGALIQFTVDSDQFSDKEKLKTNNCKLATISVFTTRADTLFGCTYVVLAPEHPLVTKLTTDEHLDSVTKYVETSRKKSELERTFLGKEKTGVFTGAYAVNPVNGEKVPVWVADYVLGHYGTGAVMAVPAHDLRDNEFAKKYDLEIRSVVAPKDLQWWRIYMIEEYPRCLPEKTDENYDFVLRILSLRLKEKPCILDGTLINSNQFDGLSSDEARKKIVEDLGEKGLASFKKNYRLHDWVLSRQRYWGVPIPMVHCAVCGIVPASEKDLPVKLPLLKDFKPTNSGHSPLAKVAKWVRVRCPKCNAWAERETDTMDTFVDSSWYFLRYTDPKNKKKFADEAKMHAWLPVPMYVGGAEHNTMHLLYSRFFTKGLYDLGYVQFNEPFTARRNHGIILGPDSQKMSKSRGNVVDPDKEVIRYGADTVRMYLAFMAPYNQGGPWDPRGINGVWRFLNRVWRLVSGTDKPSTESSRAIDGIFHRAIKKIGEDIDTLSFNTAVSELMKLLNAAEDYSAMESALTSWHLETLLKLLAPFAPHITEELWSRLPRSRKSRILDSLSESGQPEKNYKSVHLQSWPQYDPGLLAQDIIQMPVQVNGKVRDVLEVPTGATEEKIKEIALASAKVKAHISGKTVKKILVIPNRLISIVI